MPRPGSSVLPFCLTWCLLAGMAGAQTPVPVGRITGTDFRLRGQVEFAADGNAVLMSGAQVEVRSGTARLAWNAGEARLCSPAKVSVLKSAGDEKTAAEDAALLFALDAGAIELDYTGAAGHTVQTPFFTVAALPLAEPAHRHVAVRFEPNGDLCVASLRGTVRVREQLGVSEMMIPPGRAMLIPASGVEKAAALQPSACLCAAAPPSPPPPAVAQKPEASSKPAPTQKADAAPPPAAAPKPEPAPQPAAEPAAEAPGPETKTTIATAPLVYQADPRAAKPGKEAPAKEAEVTLPVVLAGTAAQAQPESQPATETRPPKPVAAAAPEAASPRRSSFGLRLKNFFRALFGRRPMAA